MWIQQIECTQMWKKYSRNIIFWLENLSICPTVLRRRAVPTASTNRRVLSRSASRTAGARAAPHLAPAPVRACWRRRRAAVAWAAASAWTGSRCRRYARTACTIRDTRAGVRTRSSSGELKWYRRICGCFHKNVLKHLSLFAGCSGQFDRQDSLRSDYLSDRETRYGIVQQASIDSTDSRLCYLTSSEVSTYTNCDDLYRLRYIRVHQKHIIYADCIITNKQRGIVNNL